MTELDTLSEHFWIKEFPASATVCDPDGVILAMNDKAAESYEADGGYGLIGVNMLACHPEPARSKTAKMLASQEKNIYTIEKNGVKKMVYQSPWYKDGQYAGFVELVFEIPFEMPHFIRS
jgi:hypothetical protein